MIQECTKVGEFNSLIQEISYIPAFWSRLTVIVSRQPWRQDYVYLVLKFYPPSLGTNSTVRWKQGYWLILYLYNWSSESLSCNEIICYNLCPKIIANLRTHFLACLFNQSYFTQFLLSTKRLQNVRTDISHITNSIMTISSKLMSFLMSFYFYEDHRGNCLIPFRQSFVGGSIFSTTHEVTRHAQCA